MGRVRPNDVQEKSISMLELRNPKERAIVRNCPRDDNVPYNFLMHCLKRADGRFRDLPADYSVFQKAEQINSVVDIGHYRTLCKYLSCLGINPYQRDRVSYGIVIAIIICGSTVFCPMCIQLCDSIRNRDLDGIIVDMPLTITAIVGFMKVLNIQSNRSRFKKIFQFVTREWKRIETKREVCMLEKFTDMGAKLASLYRRILLTFLVIFLCLPLYNPTMDIIYPLNETRARNHIFKVDYVILDENEYFGAVYIHLSLFATVIVLIIITVDSLYIIIIHHACGLFAVCGFQTQKATENHSLEKNEALLHNGGYGEFKDIILMHYEAILFYHTFERCCRNLYLIQMGLNMVVISLTAVEVVMYIHKQDELIRVVVFLVAQKFHLYVVSLPGQVLLDQSAELGEKIYSSKWYKMPVNIQRALYMMQMRCNKPCALTAGGLYEINIESFGRTVKTCVSYMTMFLSLRE